MTMRFEDPAADFVPAVQRVFGTEPRVLDEFTADGYDLLLETAGPLEHRVAMIEVDLDIEEAVREAKARLDV